MLSLLLFTVFMGAANAHADTLRCDGRIASTGDGLKQVREKCNEPAQSDRWHTDGGTVTRWLYNFGPRRLLTTVTFVNGRVTTIVTSGFGFDPDRRDSASCRRGLFTMGEPRAAVLARCGEPDRRINQTPDTHAGRLPRMVAEDFEYETSAQIHTIRFENGRLARVESRFR